MSSGDRFMEHAEALRKEFAEVCDRPVESNTVEDYQRLDSRFTNWLRSPELTDGEGTVAACEDRTEKLNRESASLELELQRLQRALANAEGEPAPRPSAARGDRAEEEADAGEALSQLQDKRLYQSYCTQLAELAGGLATAKTVFEGLLSKSVADIREERVSMVDMRFADPLHWSTRSEQLDRLLSDVQHKASRLNLRPPTEEEIRLMEVKKLAEETGRHLASAAAQRKKRDEQLAVFYGECDKLSLWCRQQLANLDAMLGPDSIQEYCRTLVDSYATMSSNLAVLAGSVQPYLRENHGPVRQALLQVDQVWYYLMVSALERLSKTLYEIHPKSRLEDEVERYAAHPTHLADTLKSVRGLLQQEAALSEEGEALLAACTKLSDAVEGKEADSVRRLKDFARRARLDREAYQCLSEAVLSRLTCINTPADTVLDSKRRQMEFEECIEELKAWATAQAHGESWRDIYCKIVEIKRVIQQEQAYVDERAGAPVN